jgi:hypothetical protein
MPRFFLIAISLFLVCAPASVSAQDDDIPLGDLARELRHSKPPDQSEVIDNDNFTLMMDKAESERLDGQPIFSISPSGRTFTAVSPDGTCSLSFVARSASPIPAAYIATDLPQDELLKLEGPASIDDGSLQVSVHNGTQWDLKEIVVGVTVLQAQHGPEYHPAMMGPVPVASEKLADLTVLYHLKGSSAPDSTAVFRGPLGGSFSEARDWHWAIVGARGIPPAAPATIIPQSLTTPLSSSSAVAPPGQSQPNPSMNPAITPQTDPAAAAASPQK